MNEIKILDCTLRDGGYCNKWEFGKDNIPKVINGLMDAKIDIIECGFLTNKEKYDINRSKFTDLGQIEQFVLKKKEERTKLVVMINVNEYDMNDLPLASETVINGIRLAFHKKDLKQALKDSIIIKEKGYDLFLQPMVSMGYTDEEFLHLIGATNEIKPFSFYIVDSFGMMKEKDLLRYFILSDTNLKKSIALGFHSHNNLQMAYSNARSFIEMDTNRKLILDVSVMGMGRGAGNLNAELMISFMNDKLDTSYQLKPLLRIIDGILNKFYNRKYWGYSLPNYLSAIRNVHPNYAMYLEEKHTLTLEGMEEILNQIALEKAEEFDKNYIEYLYINYLESGNINEININKFKDIINNKIILLIAPGKSAENQREKIIFFAQRNDVIPISINFIYPYIKDGYLFISNQRRFDKLSEIDKSKLIITSNINIADAFIKTSYKELLIDDEVVEDNSGLMCMKFLIRLKTKKIVLAGLDGYSYNPTKNYADPSMEIASQIDTISSKNNAIEKNIKILSKYVPIQTLTDSEYINIEKYKE